MSASRFRGSQMGASDGLDEMDLRLVTALQTAPRADWGRIGLALGVSASTVARRWDRLTDLGLAWQCLYPLRLPGASLILAFIELDCAAATLHSVTAHVAQDPHVFNVSHVTGSGDVLVTAGFADHASLARYVGFRLGYLDGVTATRTHLVTAVHAHGNGWRMDRLDQRHQAVLRGRPGPAPATRAGLDTADLTLLTALGADCRQPAAQLADRTGLSPTSVRRRLARWDAGRSMAYRCEVARFASGWPVAVDLWAVTPPDRVAATAAGVTGMRETRSCVSLSGRHNLMISVWLRALEDLPGFEARLARQAPELVVADRTVVLSRAKLGGHLLDADGRHLRAVPMSPWPETDLAGPEREALSRLVIPRQAGGVLRVR